MKKIITVLLSVLLIAGLFTGCNGDALAEMIGGGDTPVPTPTPEPIKYTVTFNSNGGEGSMEPQIFTEETTQALSQNKFTKYGYLFSGWSTTSSGAVVYTDKQEIKITAETVLYAIWTPEPFRFVALENSVTVKINKSDPTDSPVISLVYRKTGETEWTEYTWSSAEGYGINLNNGEEVEIKAETTNGSFGNETAFNFFALTGKVAAKGNIMFLLDLTGKSTEVSDFCFVGLFYNCNTLVEAPALPATTLGEYCYGDMFKMCSALTEAPALPATTMAEHCYYGMFYGCTSLMEAPELPATTLASDCYSSMFSSCAALTEAPALPAMTLAIGCYASMFSSCEALTEAPALLAMTLADNCYDCMFFGCSSLTTAPELPAMTLADNCYADMFLGCISLTTAPELHATTLADNCYWAMFENCTSLDSVTMLATDISAGGCLDDWLYNVSTVGTLKVSNDTVKTAIEGDYGNSAPKDGDGSSLVGSGWTVTVNP